MSGKRHADEFKIEAVKHVTERGHAVSDSRCGAILGIATHSLYAREMKVDRPELVQQVEIKSKTLRLGT